MLRAADLKVGEEIPAYVTPPVERIQLVKYASPSGDFNRIHVDEPFAKSAGYPTVFAHGMLTMAFVGRMLGDWAEPRALRAFGVRFAKIVWPGDVITCKGKITALGEEGGEKRAKLEVWAENQKGEVVVKGTAEVAAS